MFNYDKDMERLMLAKKKEVLQEFETAKKRILRELYCLKRSVHTDMCEMLADHNRINYQLKQIVDEAKIEINKIVDNYNMIFNEAFESFNNTINTKMAELESLKDSLSSTVADAISELESMETTVSNLITQVNEALAGAITQDEVQAMIDTAMEGIDLSELYQAVEGVRSEIVQSDWNEDDETNKAYVLNRTHYGVYSQSDIFTFTSDDVTTTQPFTNAKGKCGEVTNFFTLNADVKLLKITVQTHDSKSNPLTFVKELPVKVADAFDPDTNETVRNALCAYDGDYLDVADMNQENCIGFIHNPNTNKCYLLIAGSPTVTGEEEEKYYHYYWTSMEIECKSQFSAKSLLPVYMGSDSDYGRILTCMGDKAVWCDPITKSYTKYAIKTLIDGVIPYSKNQYQSYYFTLPIDNWDGFVSGKWYTVTFCGEIIRTKALSDKITFALNGIAMSITCTTEDNVFTLKIGNSDWSKVSSDSYENGCSIKIEEYTVINVNETLSPSALGGNPANYNIPMVVDGNFTWGSPCLVSPNGTIYRLTIDDNGNITPVVITE